MGETFDDFNLKDELLRGIYSYGFENPSDIQVKALPIINAKKDLIAQAQSGTGKTGCFTIGALQAVDDTIHSTQVLILSPTRELSMQTKQVVDSIGSQCKKIHTKLQNTLEKLSALGIK